ncbi:MAG TPA: VTT domain-containing protein [bacterium]|nr:VTT domain-containing protein [bacterium]
MNSADLPVLLLQYFYSYHFFIIPVLIFFITVVPVPVPEDILLISFGFLAGKIDKPLFLIAFISYVSVIISDLFLYYSGAAVKKLTRIKFGQTIFFKKIEKGIKYYNSIGTPIIFIARFIFGLRSAVFIASGFMNFSVKKFIIFNSAAGLIQIPLLICIGYFFSDKIEIIISFINSNKLSLTVLSGIILSAIITAKFFLQRKL